MTRIFIVISFAFALLVTHARAQAAVGIVNRYSFVAVLPGGANTAIQSCNSGEVLVGGGWDATSGKVFAYRNTGMGTPLSWHVTAKNNDTVTQYLYAFAVCATGDSNASSSVVSRYVSVSPGTNGTGDPACSSGYLSAGGFWSPTASSSFFPYMTYPMSGSSDNTKWRTVFRNDTMSSQYFYAYAVCVQNLDAWFDTTTIPGSQVKINPLNDQPTAYKTCSTNYYATGGGFWTSNNVPNGWIYGSRPSSTNQWMAKTHNGNQFSVMFTNAYAKCIDPW